MNSNNYKVIFLGTGASMGCPVIGSENPVGFSKNPKDHRLRSSVYIEYKGYNFIIDCTPDFRQQALREQIKRIDFLLLTHEHNDHVLGLDDLRPLILKNNKPMPIYGLERTLNEIKIRFPYAFQSNYNSGIPRFELFPVSESNFSPENDISITPLSVNHGKLPILGYKIDDLVYITDASIIPEDTLEKIKNCNILILNTLNQEESHSSHFVLKESLKIIEKINPQKTYLTHLSGNIGFYDVVEPSLPKNVHLGFDGLQINF